MTLGALALLANHGSLGGGEVMLLALAEAATRGGYAVRVVVPDSPGDLAEAAGRAGFETTTLPAASRSAYLRGLRAWRTRHPEGLAWCNGLAPALATAGLPRRVVHLHQLPRGIPQAIAARVARAGALLTVVPSAAMAAALPGSQVMANWVPQVRPEPMPEDRRNPTDRTASPRNTLVVGFLGRLSTDKGVDVLAAAVAEVQRRTPGRVRLLVAGAPLHVSAADAAVVAAALADLGARAEQPGWLPRARLVGRVDLAVFPSRWAEPFGLVVAEAMSARVPFVITDAGALPEVAGPEHPWHCPAGDPRALADTLEQALDLVEADRAGRSTELIRHLDQAQSRWQRCYSPEAGAARLAHVLAQATGSE